MMMLTPRVHLPLLRRAGCSRPPLTRPFSLSPSCLLLYKKTTPPQETKEPPSEVKPVSNEERLMQNKYYRRCPRFFRPYIGEFITSPVKFGVSFVILHEITAIVPFISFWYLMMKYDWIPLDLPQEFLTRGTEIISKKLNDMDQQRLGSLFDKTKLIMSGANAYAMTKMLLPFRVPLCFLLTPWFERWVVNPIMRLFKREKKQGKKELWEMDELKKSQKKSLEKPRL
ncbi:hypothetical protein PP7435_CHR1-1092 [Komagataella phaffii CBS 7435]|uniref:Uncharacterized protein n=2 Tax=Komagataella phaffii TaxID=460519 RepID=C4QY24_KOMPG|nr:Hypothetical protein PAS_chr1-4_0306 [Komagataella phaffii GS115]AOA60405.1 GQ67_01866T0 [Komagataella phaffii]CAH2446967.1 hypothetical protein BQ9382_C1-5740 [Komagataella phaffii CBS 7435]AOA65412.1 GQ68_01881T0 [Komagataella phaffii GS115]CAY68147.1 Hypothetical protein PAS_chr1-4_0306 [Komagataella phaffii GS115]CCA37222.1 hypothetical protein PP7435_CHR1-1092 [Komagataella phaffii CBS 7435]